MSEAALTEVTGLVARDRGAAGAVAGLAFRQVRWAAVGWSVVFAGTIASSALTYVSAYPDAATREQMVQATSASAGMRMLLGPVTEIDSVGGFTVYKCFVFLTTLGAIWALLAATRLLRGQEASGRWATVLAGTVRAPQATLATLAGLAAAIGIVFAVTTGVVLAIGQDPDLGFDPGGAVLYGLGLVSAPAVFAAVGAVTSQLARTRRLASGLGMGVFGVSFLLRMVADSGHRASWLLWTTPFGWIERTRPLTHPDWRPMVLSAVAVAALVTLAVRLSARRDLGAAVLASADSREVRPFGLGSPGGLLVRLEWPVLIGWLAGTALAGLAYGVIADVASKAIQGGTNDMLDRLGAHGSVTRQYFGVVFLLLATLVALIPAGQLGAAADDEDDGRLELVLAQPVRRRTVLLQRLGLTAAAMVAAALLGSLAAWAGARSQGVPIGFATLAGAGLNVLPVAFLVLGVGALVLAFWPRLAGPAVYAAVAWSLVVYLLASLVDPVRWLQGLSAFHYLSLAPAEPVELTTTLGTSVVAVGLLVAAVLVAGRRDLGR